MSLFFDSFWRAGAYCLRPHVIALSFLPLLLMVGLALGLGYFFWDQALQAVRDGLESAQLLQALWGWLDAIGMARLKTVLAPLIVIFAITPLLVVGALLLVSTCMTPTLLALVARRRFAQLERKRGGSLLAGLGWSLGSTALALLALLASLPLWLVPPLILVLPPLIWGWLTYRVMSFDVLSEHASAEERRALMRQHRSRLLAMGVLCGYLGAAPSIVWASGVLFAAAFVILVPVAIWIYTLVFAFCALWFAHYALAALEQLRAQQSAAAAPAAPATPSAALVASNALSHDPPAAPQPDSRT